MRGSYARGCMASFSYMPSGPFSLQAAASFGFGPNTGRPEPGSEAMRLAFVTDDMAHQAGVVIRQGADGLLSGTVTAEAGVSQGPVKAQVKRILSLDVDEKPWLEVGARDPVIGRLQSEHWGLRPVLFHSPYAAALWSVLSARRARQQAAALLLRLSQEHGKLFELEGEQVWAGPTPEQLLAVGEFKGIETRRMERAHAIARAALDGLLSPQDLTRMPVEDAMSRLQELPGIGPMYATLVLLRSTGATDVMTAYEPRSPSYVGHFYGLGRPASA